MRDMDWKVWLVIGILALGGVFELIKHFPGRAGAQVSSWDLGEGFGLFSKPYSVKSGRTKTAPAIAAAPMPKLASSGVTAEQLEKFIAQNQAATTDFEHKEKGAEGKPEQVGKLKEDKNAQYEFFVDPKTGKMYRRKKKKKKKIDMKPEIVEEVVQTPPEDDRSANDDQNIDQVLTESIAGRTQPPAPAAKKDAQAPDLNEWIARLLSRADAKETRNFIQMYQNSQVSAEIFYKITAMMIEDTRPEMKKLGVLCAGETPSVLSFSYLSEVARTVPTNEELRTYADAYIQRYAELGNLYILERILKAPTSSFATILAAQTLDQAAARFLGADQNQPPSTDPTAASVASQNASYFQRFVLILENLTRSPDPQVVDKTRQSLANLQTLLAANGGSQSQVPDQADAQAQASTQP